MLLAPHVRRESTAPSSGLRKQGARGTAPGESTAAPDGERQGAGNRRQGTACQRLLPPIFDSSGVFSGIDYRENEFGVLPAVQLHDGFAANQA